MPVRIVCFEYEFVQRLQYITNGRFLQEQCRYKKLKNHCFFDSVNVYFKFLNIVVSDLRRCEYVDKFKNKVKLLKKKGFIQLYT